jgi:homopolymeric O-antigen transport system permease protein
MRRAGDSVALPRQQAAMDSPPPGETDILITPARGWAQLNLRELWDHRELLYLFIWRNIKVRYKQTALGAAWAVIPAVMTMLVFTVIFGHLAHIASDGSPYALFSYCALVPWTYFSNSVTQASTSLIENERLVTRVYFPRLLVPLAVCLAAILDLLISFALLVILILAYGEVPDVKLLAIPGLILLAVGASFAAGMTLAALNVFYRDVRYVIAFLIQFLLFATPVAYSSSIIPDKWLPVYALNPMVGVIDGFRWGMLGRTSFPALTIGIAVVSVTVLLFGGLHYFRRVEDSFADVV